jgi:hypothetical protein
MTLSTLSSKDALREPLLELLWQQWSALGVSGHDTSRPQAMIDPEALVLVSSVFARYDARLFDEMFDWLRANGTWINVQRMCRLQKEHALGDASILGALAAHLTDDSAHLKWKALAKRPGAISEVRPLFPHLPVLNQTDEKFKAWGWLRPPVDHRGLSRPPRPDQSATFILKLRALFGRQSRAEVLAWLLAHESGHPAQIARETGYFRGSIQIVLNELELSGHIQATRLGREKRFAARKEHWRFLQTWTNDGDFPRWLPWPVLFTLFKRVHDLVDQPAFAGYSADLQAIELKRVMSPLTARLMDEGCVTTFTRLTGSANSLGVILAELQQLIRNLNE